MSLKRFLNRASSSGMQAEINITPLVDVVLVLLIIFMVVTPYLQQGIELELPFASHAEGSEADDGDPLIVSIAADGALYLGPELSSRDAISARVREAVAEDPAAPVMLKADESVRFRKVEEVLVWLRNVGATGVSLATDSREGT